MRISYNWLKEYINTTLSPAEIAALLTQGGLEVESVTKFETVKGGLAGLVIGEVRTKEKHPDADRLSITTVDTGAGELLQIVCGAANVAAGQKVVVATEGTQLFPTEGEPFVIKKSKIRGQNSEGMICAEDEIGLGSSHAGIMVLDAGAKIGMAASEYFAIESDSIFEIGLTPNRADAISHTGVARDLMALINCSADQKQKVILSFPEAETTTQIRKKKIIAVSVEDTVACPRYAGLTISNLTVKESPAWLQNRLKSVGLRPVNNIVDATNFVLHELGQPLHAFDADKIIGDHIVVKKCDKGTKFNTLDGVERLLSENDLMICNAEAPMCIAGIFGGIESGINSQTKNIFLESAYFHPRGIRKSSRFHGLKTDASFRFERGIDPDITVYALKRAALLICEISGGKLSSDITDIYPEPVQPFKIPFAYGNCDKLIGKKIAPEIIREILTALDIKIESEGNDSLLLAVPPRKVDVTRECDVIEEILRIYGYNKIELPEQLHSSLSFSAKPDKIKLQNIISDLLSQNGFSEIFSNSLSKESYYENLSSFRSEQIVKVMNPLSSDLGVLRQTMLFGGLEAIAHNQKRKLPDLKLFEFGKTYIKSSEKFFETNCLALFLTGRKLPERWNVTDDKIDFFYLKGYVMSILERLGVEPGHVTELSDDIFRTGMLVECNKKKIVEFGILTQNVTDRADASGEILSATFNWDNLLNVLPKKEIEFTEVSKYPAVRRDLALIVDKKIRFREIEQLAFHVEKNYLKEINLFDVYEGEKLGKEKKSYAVSFLLQDDNATLAEKQIEKIMEKLMKAYSEKLDASIRQ